MNQNKIKLLSIKYLKRIIQPFVEVNVLCEEKAKKIKFEFTRFFANYTSDGWIYLIVEWENIDWRFKYPVLSYKAYHYDEHFIGLRFPKVKCSYIDNENKSCKHEFEIEVGLQHKKQDKKVEFEYKFYENLGYGVCVWFAPRDWHKSKEDVEFFGKEKESNEKEPKNE